MKLSRLPLAIAAIAGLVGASAQATNLVDDPSFEAGAGGGAWVEASDNFGTPLCTIDLCGTGTGTGPRTGTWWAWFGGTSAPETGSVAQSITIPVGAASLTFWMENPSAISTTHFLQVLVDNSVLWTYTPAGIFSDNVGYTEYTVNLNAFADGNAHELKFFSVIDGGGTTNFFVDDVSVVAAPIPEPGTHGLMALGLAGLWVARRRQAAR